MRAESTTTLSAPDGTRIGVHSCGSGEPLIVLGGGLRSAVDYQPFAEALQDDFEVHLVDRRGRGLSGPLGPNYSLDTEIDDLLTVQSAVGASLIFGHSYGGLVALQCAARSNVFRRIAVYEPGVSIDGSIPTGWINDYQQLLAGGKRRRAFAYFVQQAGQAPGPIAHLPLWYLGIVLRLAIRGEAWRRIDPLLEANATEHQQVAAADNRPATYQDIDASVLLLGGSRSPAFMTTEPFTLLEAAIPSSQSAILDRLDHLAPDEKAPRRVADLVLAFFIPEDKPSANRPLELPPG